MKTNEKCCVCLRQDYSFCVDEADENRVYHKTKLKSLIPEIDWNSSHYLCGRCLHDLNIAHVFKQLCLNTLLVLTGESGGLYAANKEKSYFSRHIDYGELCSDSDEDKNTILENHILANFENEKHSVNTDNIHNILYEESRSDRVILSQIDPPQNTNITVEQNHYAIKSTTFNCKLCKEKFHRKYDLTKHERTHYNKHFCSICPKSYKRKLLLEQHVTIKHTEKHNWKHQCCYCDGVFPTKPYLISHSKRQHRTDETLICFHCSQHFTDKNILLDHINAIHQKSELLVESNDVTHKSEMVNEFQSIQYGPHNNGTVINTLGGTSGEACSSSSTLIESSNKFKGTKKRPFRMFACETCSSVFHSSVKLVHHCVNEHKVDGKLVRPFACDLCEKKFSTSAILIEHRKYHLKNRQNICSFCGKGFITKNDLNCHEYIHLNERSFKCEVCFKGFNTQKNLRTHKIVKHADPMTWKHCCTICNKRFAILSNYKVHVRRHMGDKQFCCHLCDKKFVNKDELRQHTESHSNVREFKCQYCEKEYKKKRVYEIHLTKNHGIGNAKIPKREKKHTCHLCPKSYFDKSKLNKHLLSHSGVKPFICNICDKKFTDNYYMKQHMKNCHTNIVSTGSSDGTV